MNKIRMIPLSQGKVAIVDAADYEWLMQWKWSAMETRLAWYAFRTVRVDGKRKTLLMHRVIMGITDSKIEVDHFDHDGLHNVRTNMRKATHQQNIWNRSHQRNNTSGFTGVYFWKKTNRWFAQIKANGRQMYLGMFDTPEQAARAYAVAAAKYYGKFANLNVNSERMAGERL